MEADILVLGSATFSHLPLSQAPFITRQPWERKRGESVYVWNTHITENCALQGLLNNSQEAVPFCTLWQTPIWPFRSSPSPVCLFLSAVFSLRAIEGSVAQNLHGLLRKGSNLSRWNADTLSYSHFKDPVFNPGFILIVNACSQSNQRVLCPCPRTSVSCSVWTALCFSPAQVNVSLRLNMPKTLCKCLSALIVWVKYTLGSQLQLITLWTPSIINYIWSH